MERWGPVPGTCPHLGNINTSWCEKTRASLKHINRQSALEGLCVSGNLNRSAGSNGARSLLGFGLSIIVHVLRCFPHKPMVSMHFLLVSNLTFTWLLSRITWLTRSFKWLANSLCFFILLKTKDNWGFLNSPLSSLLMLHGDRCCSALVTSLPLFPRLCLSL